MSDEKKLDKLQLEKFEFQTDEKSTSTVFVESFTPKIEYKSSPRYRRTLDQNSMETGAHINPQEVSDLVRSLSFQPIRSTSKL